MAHAGLVESIAEICPTAFINIISNPVNSLVPMAKEILTAAGVYDPRKLTGVTTLDIVRANTFVSQMKGMKTSETNVPVIGGHSGLTILPLLSQTSPSVSFTDDEIDALSARIRDVSWALPLLPAHSGSGTEGCLALLVPTAATGAHSAKGARALTRCRALVTSALSLGWHGGSRRQGRRGLCDALDSVCRCDLCGAVPTRPCWRGGHRRLRLR